MNVTPLILPGSSDDLRPATQHKDIWPPEGLSQYWREHARGRVYVAAESYPLTRFQGTRRLSEYLDSCTLSLARLCREPRIEGVNLSRTLFIDTETTGLHFRSGAFAFLVGVAYFEADRLEVRQYFTHSPEGERAMLALMLEELRPYDLLVSFNGRAFDVPMLDHGLSRHRFRNPLDELPHADLLLAARRLWKERLQSCRLSSLEHHILGITREGDVPSREIPQLYECFLSTGDLARLQPVFYHNAQDLLTLLALTTESVGVYKEPFEGRVRSGLDFLSLGRLYEHAGEMDRALRAYDRALGMPLPRGAREDACRRITPLYKRSAQLESCVAVWESLVATQPCHSVYPFEELAKYYEHQAQDYERAEQVVAQAIRLLPADTCTHTTIRDLEKRLRRIQAKRASSGV